MATTDNERPEHEGGEPNSQPTPADAQQWAESFARAADPMAIEAVQLREPANTWSAFLQARYADAAFAKPLTGEAAVELARMNRMLGYAQGCIDTHLDAGRVDLAIAQLGWMVNEGSKIARHPHHPDNRVTR